VYIDGAVEPLSKSGTFGGQHIFVSLRGAAVHINAYNFPVWGMLEKFAPAFLAGVPAVVKPATATAFVTERLVRMIVEAGVLPEGALQLICGNLGDLFTHLRSQDAVAFTGSGETAQKLRAHPSVVSQSVRFTAETDSLNASILGPDAGPDTPEFSLFVEEVTREMKYKAGQRCTAIRRALVPAQYLDAASSALKQAFQGIKIGDPRDPDVQMGPLVGQAQRRQVLERIRELRQESELLTENVDGAGFPVSMGNGAFIAPTLLLVREPHRAQLVHSAEAFGPVCSLMPYSNVADAIALAARGGGSLVASAFTADPGVAHELIMGLAPYHGRVLIVDRECGADQTGHGSPMPGLIHGGPGRAGGGEELGGIRAVLHYMQRTAVQGTPKVLASLTGA
jgi:oxepin-CoA hydrolase/3-oxo-5,6-dehydrosuberyl-CoA semialdehyde dehydrogenase